MRKQKMKLVKAKLIDAVSEAVSELQSLAEEIREVVDNAPESLQSSQRIETLGETADTLEGLDEPDVDEKLAQLEVEYHLEEPRSRRKGLSRASRRDNAASALDAAIAALDEYAEENGDKEDGPDHESLRDDLERLKDEIEGVEFPGMFG